MKKLKLPQKSQQIFKGSIIHWDEPVSQIDPNHTKRIVIPIICGKCNIKRYWRLDMVQRKMRTGEFTGFCKQCYKTLTWKEKHRLRPARRRLNDAGYMKIFAPENPMADKRGEIYEHRLIMSQILKRPLERWEHVHHKDGKRGNNQPENLELFPNTEHDTIKDMVARIRYLENLLSAHGITF